MAEANTRTALTSEEASALRIAAAEQRTRADALAAVLEDIAENGLPDPATCVPWEQVREEQWQRLEPPHEQQHVA